jgi:hypothetical protein
MWFASISAEGADMSPDTLFSFSNISMPQGIAFIEFVILTIGFFVWVARFVRKNGR